MPLICHTCHRPRNRMAERVQVKATMPIKVSKKFTYTVGSLITIGWRCIKCARKARAGGNKPAEMGNGWRRRFNLVIENLSKLRSIK
jgi:hypothetical protein